MVIDFERDYGVNAGYVQAIYEDWVADPASVDESWRRLFERVEPRLRHAPEPVAPLPSRTTPPPDPAPAAPRSAEDAAPEAADDPELEPLRGVAGRIVDNMQASLEIPVATSVRTLSAKLLAENRSILNEHLKVRALGKASYTHLIAFALVRALRDLPRAQSAYVEAGGRRYRRVHEHVNLGLAIDVPAANGRSLVVPNIKGGEVMSFREFYEAYDDVVRRGRDGKLTADDFKGTTTTLTNPGGFGTSMSVPRLMQGQGLIIATGSIGVPPELQGMSPSAAANLALGPVTTFTSTYDHRVVQGAESGLLLKRIDELLQGADGFYDEIFASMRVPWTPHRAASDLRAASGRGDVETQAKVWALIDAYRSHGGRLADLDPLSYKPEPLESLDPSAYGFTVWDLDRIFLCGGMNGKQRMSLRDILASLRRAYCRRWTIEYMHMTDHARKVWIREQVESPENEFQFDQAHRLRILDLVSQADKFENFLHTRYVGNKRFSLEGADTLIPALAEIVERAAEHGVEKVVIGMAHRGRLNVLANIMGKSYAQVFREFEAVLLPLSTEGSGDVKYHLGQRGTYHTQTGRDVEVILSANPSHLEAVDPVVCGMTRAYQDGLGDVDRSRVLAVLVHGDAAFSGQGVVAETFNMSELRAYSNGGTVHVVVNNQIGFTASPRDLRSTHYCTDTAKGVEAPIVHANGDFPESVLRAARLAVDYQRAFCGDAVVDMVCYRRWGHNEGDEPAYTQPTLYARIAKHPTVRENYTQLLQRRGALTLEEAEERTRNFENELREALASQQAEERPELPPDEVMDLSLDDPGDYVTGASAETGVDPDRLVSIIDTLNAIPQGHVTHPKLLRQLSRREKMVRGEQGVDWGCAEALAFGSIVQDGTPIRLSGQDSGRGTFSHRHAVIRDQATDADYVPLNDLGTATFEVWDSLLSEEAVLGFEYGYALARAETLVLWEAQFGDFANGAQIPIDQFIVSGEAKWRQCSGLVMLLPHGFDGMGPEHSSARPERFLSACAGGNIVVANCTTSAQYFHLLRRQAASEVKRPVVLFTPKSMLRDKRAASPVGDLAQGRFHEILTEDVVEPAKVRRVLLCTGKVYYDLVRHRSDRALEDTVIVRFEQLYPFAKEALMTELERYPDAEVVWVQEEPRNMGAWSFVLQRFVDLGKAVRYVGRPMSASPATGSYRRHSAEQEYLVERAFA
ncbi:MAG: multifunctional oxoglutarate decarboxylase/oxoglutarate dehydrogenase thiamine pyrophosphate-binding subunit/dihydrolipoyllysine-residue succinyltransferase subunit [bacterium]|nr:multifunctional oxoglutarate decarboxylase/oxoglutarate dehydrogenase thiamine pyrophosphate-binding subunit/dihydrolipoyllysine-residue succinyltransferase subunit [bacterium]